MRFPYTLVKLNFVMLMYLNITVLVNRTYVLLSTLVRNYFLNINIAQKSNRKFNPLSKST